MLVFADMLATGLAVSNGDGLSRRRSGEGTFQEASPRVYIYILRRSCDILYR